MSFLRVPAGRYRSGTIFAGLLILTAHSAGPAFAQPVGIGAPAPLFQLIDQHGRSWSLADQDGQVVLLFFFGHNAEVCASSARQIQLSLHDRYGDRGLRVLGIECWDGTTDQVGRFAERNGVTFPLLLGGRDCAEKYGVSYHSFVLIDGRGIVRVIRPGPDPGAMDLQALENSVLALLEEANATTEGTWGRIKSLYGRKFIDQGILAGRRSVALL